MAHIGAFIAGVAVGVLGTFGWLISYLWYKDFSKWTH